MIKASIYRTCPDQVKARGKRAYVGMTFSGHHTISLVQIENYCQQLAEGDGITNPRIVIEVKEGAHGAAT